MLREAKMIVEARIQDEHTDDRSSYVILSMFFSYFQQDLASKRRRIRTIAYDYGTFVTFSILESVILVFSKHSNFRGV